MTLREGGTKAREAGQHVKKVVRITLNAATSGFMVLCLFCAERTELWPVAKRYRSKEAIACHSQGRIKIEAAAKAKPTAEAESSRVSQHI